MLNREPLAEYIYNRMMKSAVVQGLPDWTVADNAGPAGGGCSSCATANR